MLWLFSIAFYGLGREVAEVCLHPVLSEAALNLL